MSDGNGQGYGDKRFSSSVKWFNAEKGYGFITKPTDFPGNKDIFLHAKVLPEGVTKIPEGTPITFQIRNSEKGAKAINVHLG